VSVDKNLRSERLVGQKAGTGYSHSAALLQF
jgi:hypothetical protein